MQTKSYTSFKLRVGMGNDAMQDSLDVASMLRSLADKIETYGFGSGAQSLRDENGNTVGEWEATQED